MSKHVKEIINILPEVQQIGPTITSPGRAKKKKRKKSKQETREESKHRERSNERKGLKECTGPKFDKNQTTPS